MSVPKEKRKQNGGLVLARNLQESITITDTAGVETVITVAKIHGNRVSLHVNAPATVKIIRTELIDQIKHASDALAKLLSVDAKRHPMQPVEVVAGVLRFKLNEIVRFLLDDGPFDLNDIASRAFSKDDRSQFAQLIGYSVSGYGDLSYADPGIVSKADEIAKLKINEVQP